MKQRIEFHVLAVSVVVEAEFSGGRIVAIRPVQADERRTRLIASVARQLEAGRPIEDQHLSLLAMLGLLQGLSAAETERKAKQDIAA